MAEAIFRHILVPTDGSEASMAAGRLAIRLAVLQGARVTFVYVVDTAIVEELAASAGKVASMVEHELGVTGQRYLDHLSRLAEEAGLTANQVVRHGIPYEEVSALADEQSVDLIVIGQVGRYGPRRILIGSVTERVIEYAPCPVLVVK
ncbi:MAG: universal stress protein [Anaerolineae bacterium]|nr:universal stress protein [Anaerolineae bacterium]